jgi:hypothetical protein
MSVAEGRCFLDTGREPDWSVPDSIGTVYDGRPLTGVVISAVDSMASRLAIWKAIRDQAGGALYIDSRMALNTMDIHIVRPQVKADRIEYSKTLVPRRSDSSRTLHRTNRMLHAADGRERCL